MSIVLFKFFPILTLVNCRPFLVIILVSLTKMPPLLLGLLVKLKIGFKQNSMAKLGIQTASYRPKYI
jgi:hypothetical protein